MRGQKHLLRSITRRKPAHGQNHQQPQQPHGQSSSVGACVEVGKFGLEEEVERLADAPGQGNACKAMEMHFKYASVGLTLQFPSQMWEQQLNFSNTTTMRF